MCKWHAVTGGRRSVTRKQWSLELWSNTSRCKPIKNIIGTKHNDLDFFHLLFFNKRPTITKKYNAIFKTISSYARKNRGYICIYNYIKDKRFKEKHKWHKTKHQFKNTTITSNERFKRKNTWIHLKTIPLLKCPKGHDQTTPLSCWVSSPVPEGIVLKGQVDFQH